MSNEIIRKSGRSPNLTVLSTDEKSSEVLQDSVEKPVDLDAGSFELGQAFLQGKAIEQKLRKELRDAQEKNIKLEKQLSQLLSEQNSRVQRESEDRRFLQTQLEEARLRYDKMLELYEELYQYCESLLSDADARRESIEKEFEKANVTVVTLTKTLNTKNEEWSRVLAQKESVLNELTTRLQESEKALEELRVNSSSNQFDANHRVDRLRLLHQSIKVAEHQLDRIRTMLSDSTRAMGEIRLSTERFMETIATKGTTALALKAGKIVLERWRLEIENMRKIDTLLIDLSKSQSALATENQRLNDK